MEAVRSSIGTRRAAVFHGTRRAGLLFESEGAYHFEYDEAWLADPWAPPISLSMPVRPTTYVRPALPAFFSGLLPEGWLRDVAVRAHRLRADDDFGLLLAVGDDCIGAVTVHALEPGKR